MEIGDNRKEWYDDYYNNYCVSAKAGKIRDTMHNLIEKRNKNLSFSKVLEIGAHNGEHLEYVRHSWDSYVMIDLDLPDEATIANFPPGVKFLKADVEKLPFEDNFFEAAQVVLTLREKNYFPIIFFCEMGIHAEEIGGEESCFVTTGASANLHDGVVVVFRITGEESEFESLLGGWELGGDFLDLGGGHSLDFGIGVVQRGLGIFEIVHECLVFAANSDGATGGEKGHVSSAQLFLVVEGSRIHEVGFQHG